MGSSQAPRLRAVFQSATSSHDCSLQPFISREPAGAISGMTEKGALASGRSLWYGPSSRRQVLAPDSLVGVWKSAREVCGWMTSRRWVGPGRWPITGLDSQAPPPAPVCPQRFLRRVSRRYPHFKAVRGEVGAGLPVRDFNQSARSDL